MGNEITIMSMTFELFREKFFVLLFQLFCKVNIISM